MTDILYKWLEDQFYSLPDEPFSIYMNQNTSNYFNNYVWGMRISMFFGHPIVIREEYAYGSFGFIGKDWSCTRFFEPLCKTRPIIDTEDSRKITVESE